MLPYPSLPVGTLGTGGPGRAGTAAAEEQLLELAEVEGDVQMVRVDEWGEEAGRKYELESRAEVGWVGVKPLFDSCGSESGEWDRFG